MKVSKTLKSNIDSYQYDEVNCYEKPVGIILDSFGKNYSSLFYMIVKMTQAYNVSDYFVKELSTTDVQLQLISRILQRLFNIDMGYIDVSDKGLVEAIKGKIDEDFFMLVPGNVIELYYSKYYKKTNHQHLFLIHGYDEDEDLFYIMDSAQFYEDDLGLYKSFVIPYNLMLKIFKKYQKEYGLSKTYYINCEMSGEIRTDIDLLKQILHLFISGLEQQPFRTIDLLKAAQDMQLSNIDDEILLEFYFEELLLAVKAKNVFLTELIKLLNYFGVDNGIIDEIENDRQMIVDKYKQITIYALVKIRKKRVINLDDILEKLIKLENNIVTHIRYGYQDLCNKDFQSFKESIEG